MHILGFDCFGHDAAAAIVRDGELVGLVEEERFLRKKHTEVFPAESIRWCLREAGIGPEELDHVVYYWDPSLARLPRLGHLLRYFPKSLGLLTSRSGKEWHMRRLRTRLREEIGIGPKTTFHNAEHHVCHAASAFLTSPYEKAAIYSLDAAGEWDCTWLGVGEGNEMRPLRRMQFPHSMGLLYGAVTEYLGFRFASGEGKVMGLAPYGDPSRYIDFFRKVVPTTPDGGYRLDLSYFTFHYAGRPKWFSRKFFEELGPGREFEGEITQHYMDVAAAVQQRTEEVGIHLARWLQRETGLNQVCLAGGVCLNSVMNGRILKEGIFDEVFVQPAANDAGTALGACFWLWNAKMGKPRTWVFEHAYFGPSYGDGDYERALELLEGKPDEMSIRKVTDAPEQAGRMLADGKIVAWFQGRMEMGPRALGHRSILTDPRSQEVKDILNARVKFRESFRPFAPSVLEEKSSEWFDSDHPSPYMILVYGVRPERQSQVPAITHVDGTGRVQTVSAKTNPRYHRLISEFERLTGVPMVLNTSFNIRGEPIVNRPEQAVECFLTTGIDALFIGDHLVTKKTAKAARAMSEADLAAAHAAAAAKDHGLNG